MIRWSIVLFVFAVFVLMPQAQSDRIAEIERQAAAAYADRDYATAIALYEGLLESGLHGAALHSNLAAAYYMQDNPGQALVNLLRARRLDPRDEQINAMIRRVRLERVDFQFGSASILDTVATWTEDILTRSELTWLTFGLWLVWNTLVIVMVFHVGLRRRLTGVLAGFTVVTLIGGGLLFARVFVEHERAPAVVIQSVATIMSGPGEDYVTLYRLFEAAEMRVLDHREGWVRFVLPDGRQGWIQDDAILVI